MTSVHASIACNVCGCEECELVYPAGVAQCHQIVRCSRCGLMRADPPGPPAHLEVESWPDDPTWDVEVKAPQRCEKERLQVRDFRRTLEALDRLHPNRGRLVEVGSSYGYLLAACRDDGWDVLGVEPDINGCKHSAKLGVQAVHGILESAHLPSASADVVVTLHVIEHVPDPMGLLREAWRILRPGGHLVVETPRYDSLMFRLLGRRERSMRCDGHVWFFTVPTLRRACELAGFTVDRTQFPGRSLTLDRRAFNLAIVARGGRFRPVDAARRAGLQHVSIRLNLRDIQRVLATKPLESEQAARATA